MENDKLRGKHLAKLRKRKGLKQSDLANLLHYSDKNISKWETGKSFPSDPDILNNLANVLEVSVEELIYGFKDNEIYDKNDYLNVLKTIFSNYKNIFLFVILFFIILILMFIRVNNYYYAKVVNNNIKSSRITIKFTNKYNEFKFRKLHSINKDIHLVYFYYNDNDVEYLLFESANDTFVIKDYPIINEYNFNFIFKSNCYLKVVYNDESYDIIKLKFKRII